MNAPAPSPFVVMLALVGFFYLLVKVGSFLFDVWERLGQVAGDMKKLRSDNSDLRAVVHNQETALGHAHVTNERLRAKNKELLMRLSRYELGAYRNEDLALQTANAGDEDDLRARAIAKR